MSDSTPAEASSPSFEMLHSQDFVSFEKGHFPRLLDSYGGMLLPLVTAAFKLRNENAGFLELLKPYVAYDNSRNVLVFDEKKSREFMEELINKQALQGSRFFELLPDSATKDHISALRTMGCNISAIKPSELGASDLESLQAAINETFDITFSNVLMGENPGVTESTHSGTHKSMEMYALFSSITRKNGYSIHAGGRYVSSLYTSFLDFIGFRIVKYFKFGSGPEDSVLILRKYNNKQTTFKDFEYLYKMLNARDALRYR